MDIEEFRGWQKEAADWVADYRAGLGGRKVRSQLEPGEFMAKLPAEAPEQGEDFAAIMADFAELIPEGVTHWQHPRFFAYFQANASLPSVVAEQLTAGIGAQCMLWQTSPAGTELEIRMLEWLAGMCGLPGGWKGVIQDSASGASLTSIITARERALDWEGHRKGLSGLPRLRFYTTANRHSSFDKAVWLAGIGAENLVEVPADSDSSMDPDALREAIAADRAAGHRPAGLLCVVGATGTGVSDKLPPLGDICREEGLYGHVDSAWAGTAMVCPEHRHLIDGLERFDSYVFNPHKWLGTNFDLSAHFVREPDDLVRTMATRPSYLVTQHAAGVPDLSNWSIPLGRRFRSLKLWFVLRSFGVEGLRRMIRDHVAWTAEAAALLEAEDDFEMLAGPHLGLFVFRHAPAGVDGEDLNTHNEELLDRINADGFTYLTQTHVGDTYGIRVNIGTNNTTRDDVIDSAKRIIDIARSI